MLNHIVLIGRFTAVPELRHTSQDIAVTSFTLAVTRDFISVNEERKTDFIDVDAWRSTAEFICKHFQKGNLIFVSGSLNTSTYTDKNGEYKKRYKVIADKVDFVSPKSIVSTTTTSSDENKNSPESVVLDIDIEQQSNSKVQNDFEPVEENEDYPF